MNEFWIATLAIPIGFTVFAYLFVMWLRRHPDA